MELQTSTFYQAEISIRETSLLGSGFRTKDRIQMGVNNLRDKYNLTDLKLDYQLNKQKIVLLFKTGDTQFDSSEITVFIDQYFRDIFYKGETKLIKINEISYNDYEDYKPDDSSDSDLLVDVRQIVKGLTILSGIYYGGKLLTDIFSD